MAAGADVNAKDMVGVCGEMGGRGLGTSKYSSCFHRQCASMNSMNVSVGVWIWMTQCIILCGFDATMRAGWMSVNIHTMNENE